MAIEINRDQIIYGAATRLSLDGNDLGPTTGGVTVRREVELIDITTDLGTVIDKFQNRDQMFVEMELAQSTLQNLVVAWGGTVVETTDSNGDITALELALDSASNLESTRELVIEGPGSDNFVRRYTLPNVVSLVQTEQNIRKDGIISIPIEFEVMMDPQASEEHFGRIDELSAILSLRIVSGNRQSAVINGTLANPLVVEVQDQNGDLISGVDVEFVVTEGSGTLSAIVDTTDANGRAQATLTLGANVGANTVTATIDGFVVEFTATGQARAATSVHSVSGNSQATVVNGTLANPFVVEVRDQDGNPIEAATINFAVTAGGGTLSASSDTTDGNGQAETTLTLGPNLGTNTVRVSVSGIATTIDFTATGQAQVATSLHEFSGDSQSLVIDGTLANPFVVEVRNQIGNGMSGVTVNFAVTAGGGTLSASSDTTDDNGQAETTLTLGGTAGTNTVQASVSGITDTIDFTATGVAQTPTTIHKISGDTQSGIVDSLLANPLVVEVRDQIGNSISGVTVNFVVTIGDGILSAATGITDSNGQAQVTFTFGMGIGTNTVRATVQGVSSAVEFTATASAQTATSLNIISGAGQAGASFDTLANPFVVEVRDQIDNPISGVTVNFTVQTGSGTLSAANTVTSATGRAQSVLTLGQDLGINTVRASIAGLTADFTATVNILLNDITATDAIRARGIAWDGTSVLAANSDDDNVLAWTNGVRDSSKDLTQALLRSAASNIDSAGITWDGSSVLIFDATNDAIWAFTNNARDSSKDVPQNVVRSANASITPRGLGWDGVSLLASDINADAVWAFTNQARDSSKDLTQALLRSPNINIIPQAVTWDGSSVLVLDSQVDTVWAFTNQARDSSKDLSIDEIRAVNPSIFPAGLAFAINGVFVSDTLNDTILFIRTNIEIDIFSGNNQSEATNNQLANPFIVEVRHRGGDPIAGAVVQFSVQSGNGSLSNATGTTDANGRAQTTLTVGPNAGTNTVHANINGRITEFTANGT